MGDGGSDNRIMIFFVRCFGIARAGNNYTAAPFAAAVQLFITTLFKLHERQNSVNFQDAFMLPPADCT
jgi:hypothetical protein